MMTEFQIYSLDKAYESDPFTDLHTWRRYFQRRSEAYTTIGELLRGLENDTDKIVKKFEDSNIVNYSQAKMEREYGILRDVDKTLADGMFQDAKLYSGMATALKDFQDEDSDAILLAKEEEIFREARKEFRCQTEKTNLMKDKYHKSAFEAEKAEIKKALADKESEIEKHTKQSDTLRMKIERKIEQYRQEFKKLKNIGKTMKEASNKYTEAKARVDTKRADFILANLKKQAKSARLWQYDIGESGFDGVRRSEVIEARVPKETIKIKKLEKYRGTKNKEVLLKQVQEELRENTNNNAREETTCSNVPEKNDQPLGQTYLSGQKYLVTRPFEKKLSNQISLIQGKYVVQIMPANEEGFAFGEKKGRLGRKKKGYYPVANVVPAFETSTTKN